jgi:hypothetical protein
MAVSSLEEPDVGTALTAVSGPLLIVSLVNKQPACGPVSFQVESPSEIGRCTWDSEATTTSQSLCLDRLEKQSSDGKAGTTVEDFSRSSSLSLPAVWNTIHLSVY